MRDIVKIGTRGSRLALWQAEMVERALSEFDVRTERVIIRSQGDIDQSTPLDRFDAPGVFTNAFDRDLLGGEIDIAVHSLKDYPASTPNGIALGAFLKRGNPVDTLVLRVPVDKLENGGSYQIATSSSRRRAQWMRRFPGSASDPIRGNVPTRLAKLYESSWDGAIFARAGLQRLGIQPPHAIDLGWMVPAPGQAVVMAACRENDHRMLQLLNKLSDFQTTFCVTVERDFMQRLGGGCEAPIGALATLRDSQVHFKGCLLSEDGSREISINTTRAQDDPRVLARVFADQMLHEGAEELLSTSTSPGS